MTTPFRRTRTGDRDLDAVQENVDEALRPIQACPIIDGSLVTGAEIPSGSSAPISHRLGRIPRGWMLVSPSADVRIWETEDPTSRFLHLRASTPVTASLWVF